MIHTIGYAGIKLPQFVEILKQNKITHLIDVRSTPRSQYFPDFNDSRLALMLKDHNIKYENWKTEFGARQDNPEFYTDGILDFEKFAQSPQFQTGIKKVKNIIESCGCICLMCAEIDPFNCHRAILVARNLRDQGFDIKHIVARNSGVEYQSQQDLEDRLLKLYFKQQSFLGDELETAYKKHNEKIGYKRQN